jgi:diketogulonate reductase-like aldo/keto reductase
MSKEYINPQDVPYKVLRTGDKIPMMGLGTFGSDKYSDQEVASAVKEAIRIGYRHLDCATVYMNEDKIGASLKEMIDSKEISREELWITGKVWNDQHHEVEKACLKSLKDLGIDYFDLYLIHWPFPNYHAPGCDGDSRNKDSIPFNIEEFLRTWRQLEDLVRKGFVKNIGTSNMTVAKFEEVIPFMEIFPAANEFESHPCFQQEKLFKYCINNEIQPISYCPIGSPSRPERDRTETDAVDTEHPVVLKIAERLNVHPAVVCLKWAVQRGQIPIPFSVKEYQLIGNLKSITENPLTDQEMDEMKTVEMNSRLIKGQVFLWEGAKDWKDLWDEDGKIAQ